MNLAVLLEYGLGEFEGESCVKFQSFKTKFWIENGNGKVESCFIFRRTKFFFGFLDIGHSGDFSENYIFLEYPALFVLSKFARAGQNIFIAQISRLH
jgi:hypothetical protein